MKESFPVSKNINTMRHFDELDDIYTGKRDGELVDPDGAVTKYAVELNRSLTQEGFSAVMLIASNKKRSVQTAELISHEISKLNNRVKTLNRTDGRLDSLDEGNAILPDDYEKGDHFPGFVIASKIFMEEAHGTDFGKEEDNIRYKYGDPVKLSDGGYQYPELVKYFSSPGESYSEYLLRIYSFIKDSIQKSSKFERRVKIVLVTHAQTFQLIKSLLIIYDNVKSNKLKVEKGKLSLLCWSDFLERRKEKTAATEWSVDSTNLLNIDVDVLKDPILEKIINQEIEYLK